MRVFAVSDLHVDYTENARWVSDLSTSDYTDDVLVLAGDVCDLVRLFAWCLDALAHRFHDVLFVPGNHDLWVIRERGERTSFGKLARVSRIAAECGVCMATFRRGPLSIVPLLGWYDYSFGSPIPAVRERWMDYRACRWPDDMDPAGVTQRFVLANRIPDERSDVMMSFSHFLPRIDLMPPSVPARHRILYPVLGTTRLEEQIRQLSPLVHVYGHSHLNRRRTIEGITYVNNALGYPTETTIAARQLVCLYDSDAADGRVDSGRASVAVRAEDL